MVFLVNNYAVVIAYFCAINKQPESPNIKDIRNDTNRKRHPIFFDLFSLNDVEFTLIFKDTEINVN